MNRVVRISRIRGFGVFRNFEWPEDLPDFRRYNVIYGWNGSGKTLLSRIFSSLQKGQAPPCDEVVVRLSSGEDIRLNAFTAVPKHAHIRVFNQDFVEQNVYRVQGSIEPIYVFGERAKEEQQQLEGVMHELQEAISGIEREGRELDATKRQLDELLSEGAKAVRETLQIPGRHYERDHFRHDIERLSSNGQVQTLSEAERATLLQRVRAEPRKRINTLSFSFAVYKELFEQARVVCGSRVLAEVIEELQQRPDVNVWVEQGLGLHKRYAAQSCLFCDQPLPSQRLKRLEAHFSEAYRRVTEEVQKLEEQVRGELESIKGVTLPDPDLLYPDLRETYAGARSYFYTAQEQCLEKFERLLEVLAEKRKNPFQDLGATVPPFGLDDEAVIEVNAVLRRHNELVERHEEEVRSARDRLKQHIIADRIERYRELKSKFDEAANVVEGLKQAAATLEARRKELEEALLEHARAAEELNRELASYLGHSELRFEVERTGYRIVRNGERARALSEGEKTAIAFLYFLKSLQDRDFDVRKGIVVIDDPVSSLDANALYYAFGFMKSRVREAGQLFVLTHNFLFFRQVKNWFKHVERRNKGDCGYYMIVVQDDGSRRNSRLAKLDRLLEDYETEYHYLFALVYRASHLGDENRDLQQYYYLPNVIRRLLEAFIEFKVPGKGSPLRERLDELPFDSAKKERIRRFCDTHSHSRVIDEPEQDPVILGEARAVAQDVMELIREADEDHFRGMVRVLGGDG